MAEQIKKSSVSMPANPQDFLSAANLEDIASKIRQGKIKQDEVTGYTDEDGNFIISLKLRNLKCPPQQEQ